MQAQGLARGGGVVRGAEGYGYGATHAPPRMRLEPRSMESSRERFKSVIGPSVVRRLAGDERARGAVGEARYWGSAMRVDTGCTVLLCGQIYRSRYMEGKLTFSEGFEAAALAVCAPPTACRMGLLFWNSKS